MERFYWLFIFVATISYVGSTAFAQEETLGDRFARRVPTRVKIESLFYSSLHSDDEPMQRHRHWVSPDLCRADKWLLLEDDLGENLMHSGTDDGKTSRGIDAQSRAYIVLPSDPLSLTLNSVTYISPLPLIYALLRDDEAGAKAELIETDGDRQTYRLLPNTQGRLYFNYHEIDVVDNRIVEYRGGESPKRITMTTEYLDYRPVGEGLSHPFRIVQWMAHQDVEGGTTIVERIQTVEPLADEEIIPPIKVPKSYYIVDHIEGVTKYADGTVIGPIQVGTPSGTPGSASSVLKGLTPSRIVTFLGVGLVAIAAFVYMRRVSVGRSN